MKPVATSPQHLHAAHWLVPPQPLICHPAAPAGISLAITASVEHAVTFAGEGWRLRYEVRGDLSALLIPEPASPGPADGLWQHTCFEAFVAERGAAYQEFNFSPSGQWASYRFSAERVRDTAAESASAAKSLPPPSVAWHCTPEVLVLEAWLPVSALHTYASGQPLDLGLTAVIETRDQQLSYWALRHPGAKPDFHHRQGFALQVSADLAGPACGSATPSQRPTS
ncbi:hypothetical protein J2W49_000827 [Hydrogenophaga palleronii]|uniref:DOMON-like domain-containing protein n=1 Tax=Hydrogenophaga palleronii TaxID=65655 RepID=A0ABU1WIL6_9BURK|nr:DOMON-like domain-containing protein [Hydrogenophaga palleronii]MDR7148899.1 hypothetical protein [Hydrogenophaga palleronii]